jgi:uncharacterized protein (DUF1499 family)
LTWVFAILGIAVLAAGVAVIAARRAAARAPAPELGIQDGRLSPCPDAPNCVSSQAHPYDDAHYLAPLAFHGDPDAVVAILDKVVEDRPLTELVERSDRYLRYTFRTYLLRFVDDVEFWVDADASLIHFRAASRRRAGDMGANRTRMRSLLDDVGDRLERAGLAADEAS